MSLRFHCFLTPQKPSTAFRGAGLLQLMILFLASAPTTPLNALPFASAPQSQAEQHDRVPDQCVAAAPTLRPRTPVEAKLSPGSVQCFRVGIVPSQYMHVVVMQKGIDLALRLYNSKGDLVGGEVDSPNGRFGPEPISEVVPPNVTSRVDYLLVVSSQDDAPVRPDYTVTLEELREAKPEDESYVAGERSFLDAQLKLSQLPEMKSRDDALAAVGPLVKKLEELRSLFHSVGRPEMESRAHSRLGKANLLLGDVRGARTHYEAAASLGADDDPATRADILAELADVYLVTRELPRALAAYDQSAELSHAASDYEKEAETLTYTGTIYFNLSLWSAALEHYERALKLEGVREPKNRSNTLYNLGVVLSARGQKQEALDALRQAERLGGGEPQLTAYLLNSIGYIYAELGQEVAAQEYFDRSLKISSPDHIYLMAEVDSYLYKGLSYYRVGDQKKGYEFSEKALLLLSEPRDDYKRKRANALVNMGQFFFNRGEKARALGFLERALPLQRDVGDRHGMAYTLTDMANIYSAQGDKEKALAYYADALNLRREVGDRQGEVETRYLVALEDLARGHLSEARAHLKAAVDTIEFLRANVASEDLRASYFATSVKVYSLSVDVLMQLDKREPGRGYAEQALEMSESSRARSLLNVLNAAKVNVRQGIDPTLLKEEQELKRKLAVNLSRQKLQPPSAGGLTEAVAALEREAEELLEKLRDLRIKIRNSDPNSAELAEPEPIKTAKIKSLLDADTLLIEFAIGEERSYGWVVSADQQPIPFVLPGRKLVEDATRPVLDIVSAAPPTTAGKGRRARGPADDNGAYEKAARVLSGMLFKDVADKLGTKRLVIIPDGVLQYVPFSALPSLDGAQGSGWEPLLARHEVVIIPSASTLEAIRENLLREERAGGRPAPQLLAMFADPVYTLGRSKGRPIGLSRSGASVSAQVGIELPQLAFAKAEIKEIERVVGKSGNAGRWKLWKDSDVNRENATADVLSSYRIVHYSAHGKLDRSRPESSGIVLSIFDGKGELRPDYFLGLSDVYGLNLTADLVVLGACQSAGGKEIKGEGVVGLTRGFMYAGAPRVVSSLWEVNDFRTAQFMGLFYKNLLENRQTPAAALRATQKTMWQEYKLPPYFWAAFQMQGEWR